MIDHARAIPVLASLDLEQSRRFYSEKLGFAVDLYGDYLIAKRDEMELHFWLASDRIHPENTSCYIRGGQVPALYEEYSRAGIGTDPVGGERISDFVVRPWDMKEFYVWDCHGNLLRFGCAPQEI
jgi:hypothetical protein